MNLNTTFTVSAVQAAARKPEIKTPASSLFD
jgi:hypothetical protein